MIDSNLYTLTHGRLPPDVQARREAQLEETLRQLELYRHRQGLKPSKVSLIDKLIAVYNQYLTTKGA